MACVRWKKLRALLSAIAMSVHNIFYVAGFDSKFSRNCFWRWVGIVESDRFSPLMVGQFCLRSVASLLHGGCPPTILGAVRAVIVYPVNRTIRWLGRHVKDKIGHIHPAFTNRDAAPAVPAEFCILGIDATLHHAAPSWVERVIPQAVLCLWQIGAAWRGRLPVNSKQWIAMPAPAKVMLTTPPSCKERGFAKAAFFHACSITHKRTFEKTKGVAS